MAGLPWNNIRLLYNGYGWVIGGEVDAAASNALVYQPGGTGTGPVVFSSWSDMMVQLANLRSGAGGAAGAYAIQFDDSIVSPCVVPVGVWDMTDVMWCGSTRTGANFYTQVTLADGVQLTRLREFGPWLNVKSLCTVTSPCTDLLNGDFIMLRGTNLELGPGGVPFYNAIGVGAGGTVLAYLEFSSFAFHTAGSIIHVPNAGAFLAIVTLGGSVISKSTALTSAAGALLLLSPDTLYQYRPAFPGWLGTILDPNLLDRPAVIPRPFLTAPAVAPIASPTIGNWLRLNAAGGAIVQPLPAIAATGFSQPGGIVVVTETGGGAALTVAPAGANTIDGVAAAVAVDPLCSALFVSDGVNDWHRVAQWTPQVVLNTTTPARAIAAAFQPSTEYDCLVRYGVETVAGNFGVGAGDGYVELLCDAANPPTIPRDRSGAAGTAAAVVKVYGSVGFLVPKGWWVLLNVPPALNVTHALVDQVEQLVHP